MSFSALQWMAPELARAGLVRNENWIVPNVERAVGLFSNQGMHTAATLLAAVHPRAIDYIEQAPVLVLAATAGGRTTGTRDRARYGIQFSQLIERGPKLRDLMGAYGVEPALRAITGNALRPGIWWMIGQISRRIDASSIAQSIPTDPTKQMHWLGDVYAFWLNLERRGMAVCLGDRADTILRWAMFARGRTGHRRHECQGPSELADFIAAMPAAFNPRWTWERALEASLAWHDAMAVEDVSKIKDARLDVVIDYGRFPLSEIVDGFQFVALRTMRELLLEGRTMHHCVGSYYPNVAGGMSRIYSIRKDGRQLATAEYAIVATYDLSIGIVGEPRHVTEISRRPGRSGRRWAPVQVRGHCNAKVSQALDEAAFKFSVKLAALEAGDL